MTDPWVGNGFERRIVTAVALKWSVIDRRDGSGRDRRDLVTLRLKRPIWVTHILDIEEPR